MFHCRYDLFFFTSRSQIMPNEKGRMDVNDGVHKPFFWKVNAVKNVMDAGQSPESATAVERPGTC